jgi:hypothetical protein
MGMEFGGGVYDVLGAPVPSLMVKMMMMFITKPFFTQ